MNETEIIQGAREILSDPKRWHKGWFTDGQGAFCVRGALAHVAGNVAMTPLEPWVRLRDHLPEDFRHFAGGPDMLAAFNDHPDTTHQDIINLLDKTLADMGALV